MIEKIKEKICHFCDLFDKQFLNCANSNTVNMLKHNIPTVAITNNLLTFDVMSSQVDGSSLT